MAGMIKLPTCREDGWPADFHAHLRVYLNHVIGIMDMPPAADGSPRSLVCVRQDCTECCACCPGPPKCACIALSGDEVDSIVQAGFARVGGTGDIQAAPPDLRT